jgi:hypothetical protein
VCCAASFKYIDVGKWALWANRVGFNLFLADAKLPFGVAALSEVGSHAILVLLVPQLVQVHRVMLGRRLVVMVAHRRRKQAHGN